LRLDFRDNSLYNDASDPVVTLMQDEREKLTWGICLGEKVDYAIAVLIVTGLLPVFGMAMGKTTKRTTRRFVESGVA